MVLISDTASGPPRGGGGARGGGGGGGRGAPPALGLAEGLMPYLRESQVRRLVERLVDHLGSGEL
ncbi:hypothetical protein ACRCPB_14200, partial [Pseudomonas aeruginosa]